jgi:hypothetical protein
MKRERDPTPEEFQKFLAWLDSDCDEAARKFQVVQSRLVRIFISRGCMDAELLADEVTNRVAVRIDQVKENYGDPLRCCVGFVDNVYREHIRDERKKSNVIWPAPPRPPEELEREDECLRQCLEELTNSDRQLVENYFQGEKGVKIARRKKLAAERRLTPNALRIQAFKLRKKLRLCLRACLERAEAETLRA